MRAIIWQVLKARRRSILAWSLAPSAYIVLVCAVYNSFLSANSGAVSRAFAQLPATVKSFVQIQGDFFSPVGFLSSEPYYLILPLVLIAFGVAIGSSLLAREEQNHTIELLLARPISRGKLLLAKGLSGLMLLLVVNIVIGLVVSICIKAFGLNGVSGASVWLAQFMLFLLAAIFGSLSFAITAAGNQVRQAAVGGAALLAVTGYILTSLEGSIHWLAWPARLLPYHYFDPRALLSGDFSSLTALCFALVVILLAGLAWFTFSRRDVS